MTQTQFQQALTEQQELISQIANSAARLHESVNQHYDHIHPYSFHLNMVADAVRQYGHEVCASAADVVPMMFGAYYHDSMEDARQTYNDVMRTAQQFMSDEQALVATEIVYALTNDKGRTRAERAGERYYAGIRQTPYAPLVKLCDRYANSSYSVHTPTMPILTCAQSIFRSCRTSSLLFLSHQTISAIAFQRLCYTTFRPCSSGVRLKSQL